MFPIRNDIKARHPPLAVYLLIAINVAVFWKELALPLEVAEIFLETHGLVPGRDWTHLPDHWRPFFTSMFLHGGFLHILSNMWALWIFGEAVEGALGSGRFLAFYMVSGVAAAFTHAFLNPMSAVPVVGASGAIAGVMGAYLVLFPRSRLRMFTILVFYPIFFELPAVVFFVLWFVGQLLSAISDVQRRAHEAGGIAFAAHLGGFLAGMVLLPLFKRRRLRARSVRAE